MKKYILPLSLALTASVAVTGQSKLDGKAKAVVDYYKQVLENPNAEMAKPYDMPFEINTKSRAASTALVYITLEEGVSAKDIEALGFEVKAKAGNMVIAEGSIDDIIALGDSELVKNVAFGGKAEPTLVRARAAVGADDIQNGTGLSRGYTGKGVICGIYDIGIDPNHPNFRTRDLSESRVKHVWYYPGKDGSYTERTTPEEIASFESDSKSESHGTHTLGCMAGAFNEKTSSTSGYADLDEDGNYQSHSRKDAGNIPYYGIAYDADLAVSCGGLYDNNTTIACSRMVEYAKEQGKPIVISLSIGSVVGSHDEYGTFASYMDNLGKDAIICIAAGNDGESNMSFKKTFTASDNQLKTFFDIDDSATTGTGEVTVYSKDSTPFTVTPVLYDTRTREFVWTDATVSKTGTTTITTNNYTNGVHYGNFDKAFSTSYLSITLDDNANTSKRFGATIDYTLTYNSGTNSSKRYRLGFIIEGTAGQSIEAANTSSYVSLVSNDMEGFQSATPEFSISSMACGKNVIVVGAYNSNDKYVPVLTRILEQGCVASAFDFSTSLPTGEAASFSSYGELYDGRILPTVCAPGSGVISSVNSYESAYGELSSSDYLPSAYYTYNGKRYFWAQMSGTSMATPIVSGSIATWLEAYPELTVQEALDIIQETAIQDEYTAKGNKVQWGAGKFNAIGGLKKVLAISGVANISADNTDVIVSNKGGNVYEAFVAGANKVNAQVYNMSGQLVAQTAANGEQVEVDASALTKGIYILRVNGSYSQRIMVK